MSLRARLVLGVLLLTGLGLSVAGTLTYVALESYLVDRIDRQLDLLAGPVETGLSETPLEGLLVGERVQEAAERVAYPPGTYAELRRADGSMHVGAAIEDVDGAVLVAELPAVLPGSGTDEALVYLTVPATTRPLDLRVRAEARPGGGTLVVGVPFNDVQATLDRLVRVQLLVSSAVLGAVGLGGLFYVHRSLQPLREVAATADEIAAGERGQRLVEHRSRTEVGRMDRALNTMLDQLEEALVEREASEERLRRFIADASHELRTPLTSIRGYAELFRLGAAADPDDLATTMRRIEEESVRMSAMVEDLLLLARLDEGPALELESVDLDVIARDAVADALAAHPERSITVQSDEHVHVRGDENRLRQVAVNLLSNACAHTPSAAAVHVGVRHATAGAVLEVRDDGPGLEPDDAARVFERFNRGEPGRLRQQGSGTGLGLAIVAAIVHAHGGSVALDTTAGAGCTFTVTLPADRNSDAPASGSR